MAIDFTPQFHKKLSKSDGHGIWIALPHPITVIPAKIAYYHAWQQEECQRLKNAGEEVVAFVTNH